MYHHHSFSFSSSSFLYSFLPLLPLFYQILTPQLSPKLSQEIGRREKREKEEERKGRKRIDQKVFRYRGRGK